MQTTRYCTALINVLSSKVIYKCMVFKPTLKLSEWELSIDQCLLSCHGKQLKVGVFRGFVQARSFQIFYDSLHGAILGHAKKNELVDAQL